MFLPYNILLKYFLLQPLELITKNTYLFACHTHKPPVTSTLTINTTTDTFTTGNRQLGIGHSGEFNSPSWELNTAPGRGGGDLICKIIKVSIWKQKYNSFSPTTKIKQEKNNSYHFSLTKIFYILLIPHPFFLSPLLLIKHMPELIFLYKCLILKDSKQISML